MLRVASADGVSVAVHRLAGETGRPPLLISHATGFHAHCYAPVARRLGDRFDVHGLDHRGHGLTDAPPGLGVDWRRFGVDVLAVAEAIAPRGGLVGVGHSMGGAALLMAAAAHPDRFARLVLFEPIAFPASIEEIDMDAHPIVVGARRRRRGFDSLDEAVANFSDKPPLSSMTAEVLRLYVEHGFGPVDGGVELRCSPEYEAEIFIHARSNGVWDDLPHVTTPTLVIAGRVEERQPSERGRAIAERLANGTYLELPHQTHFGPFSHPDELADLVLETTR